MRLYFSQTSPYVRKVMVLLHETEQLEAVELVPASGTPLAPAEGLGAANPLTKVPALERPDGPTLYDSRVITQFLNARAGATLYPQARYFDVLTLEATGDGITDAALLMVYETRLRREEIRFPEWVEGQWSKIERALDVLNTRWMSHLNGPLDAGQISVACALGYLDFRHDARNWRQGRDALAAWFEAFSNRASMVQTRPDA
ncbi:glutathione S-transferase [Pseudoruegeria sp. SHC-113]|uniref:glutathione S-transferase n=1 Tax=Pseudoruegeria sp. SHC-113 TaxID=2855439 RepID=UPI0021BAAF11|nr:glutathione S-transferase [Pseudoruegeria sp. SHC-113]MCT8158738.1 glutathione S-transferase [Pseudoruegeria sp. SHC-113]